MDQPTKGGHRNRGSLTTASLTLVPLDLKNSDGTIAAVVQRQDQAAHLTRAGVHTVVNIYGGAGAEVADAAMELPSKRRPDDGADHLGG